MGNVIVLEEAQLKPFTRRVPNLPEKQMARDRKIITQIVRAIDVEQDIEKGKEIFFRKCRLLSNPLYWEVLRSIWVVCGKTENSDEFRHYFRSPRPCKGWFMTVEDAAALDAMEFPLTVYRAYDREPDPGISWTLDKEWCEEYAKSQGRQVKQRQVERKDIFAYISRRGESEIMIL